VVWAERLFPHQELRLAGETIEIDVDARITSLENRFFAIVEAYLA
jgi:hypothetical protein